MRATLPLIALAFLLQGCTILNGSGLNGPDKTVPIEPLPEVTAASPAEANPTTETTDPPMPDRVHWVRNSAEYQAALYQVYQLALAQVEKLADGRAPGTWAVALDGDETVLSNSPYEKARGGTGLEENSWREWVESRQAPALRGALPFLQRVREMGGKIAIVTNRSQHSCPATEDNFHARDLPFDVILCRTDDSQKEPRWERVENGTAKEGMAPAEILVWVGDAITDFPNLDQELRFEPDGAFSAFGERFFIVPNPLYGGWRRNPRD
ncbi:MAG: HAD family acid phosphatase [Acidobacteriota bacterium]